MTRRALALAFLLGAAARPGRAAAAPAASGDDSLVVSPAHGWVLPVFTPDGYRSVLLRGDQVQVRRDNRIDMQDVNIALFSGRADNRVTTIILSPEASYFPRENRASGPSLVRVVLTGDDTELTGADWTYQFQRGAHDQQEKLIIRRDARVVLKQSLHDFLP